MTVQKFAHEKQGQGSPESQNKVCEMTDFLLDTL